MSEPEIGILMLGMLVILIMLGFPIAFTLIAMGIGFGYFAIGDIIFPLLVQRAYGVMSNDVLIAVPLFLTARTSAMVCWLFVGSWIFSSVFSLLDGHSLIEHWISGLSLTPLQFLLLAQLMIFILGWPLEWTEIIIIFVPIFLPLLHMFGIDPLFFGVLVALNIQTSFLTPPFGFALFYLRGVTPASVPTSAIYRGVIPFIAMQLAMLLALALMPGLATWLPSVL